MPKIEINNFVTTGFLSLQPILIGINHLIININV